MLTSRPAAGPALTFLELLLGSANAALSGHLSLGILDPADELVSGQGCDVVPCVERLGVGDQRLAQVRRQFVHHPTGHSLAAHTGTTVAGSGIDLYLLEIELEPDEPPVALGCWLGAPTVGECVDQVEATSAGASGRVVEYGSGEAGAVVGHLGSDLIGSDLDFEDDGVGGCEAGVADAVSHELCNQESQVEDCLGLLVEAQLVDRTAGGTGGFDGCWELE